MYPYLLPGHTSEKLFPQGLKKKLGSGEFRQSNALIERCLLCKIVLPWLFSLNVHIVENMMWLFTLVHHEIKEIISLYYFLHAVIVGAGYVQKLQFII